MIAGTVAVLRNAPQACSFLSLFPPTQFSRFALIAGETPAVPANRLIGVVLPIRAKLRQTLL